MRKRGTGLTTWTVPRIWARCAQQQDGVAGTRADRDAEASCHQDAASPDRWRRKHTSVMATPMPPGPLPLPLRSPHWSYGH
jgi:hypothetical protein